ncbi:MAG: cytochrome C oxidase subunit IV family protein [Candidatus Zixiibacteriota bacterium]|nr:MAG: cytochrome C oxidase subunit IV family protein [candidate division Zixibacteria bacterium]
MGNRTTAVGHHILPLKVYLGVGAALIVLTAITVTVSFFNFGPYNLLVAMVVAAIKASLVALFFMHLKYDSKLYMIIFVAAILFLAVFIIFTLFDTLLRGDVEPITA